jgi:S1-C subfamily serine protease
VIISVNGIAVASSSELQEQVSRFRPGDQIQIALYRGRELRQFSVNLKTLSGHNRGAAYRTKLLFRGAEFRRPEAAELQRMGITAGIMVERPNETMTEAGIQVGYVITQVNGKPIATIEDLEKRLMQAGEHLVLEGRYSAEKNTSYSFDW